MAESAAAHPVGTTVEVRNLFLNLPVRRVILGTGRADVQTVATTQRPLALLLRTRV